MSYKTTDQHHMLERCCVQRVRKKKNSDGDEGKPKYNRRVYKNIKDERVNIKRINYKKIKGYLRKWYRTDERFSIITYVGKQIWTQL